LTPMSFLTVRRLLILHQFIFVLLFVQKLFLIALLLMVCIDKELSELRVRE
jgi:hypothetical protein